MKNPSEESLYPSFADKIENLTYRKMQRNDMTITQKSLPSPREPLRGEYPMSPNQGAIFSRFFEKLIIKNVQNEILYKSYWNLIHNWFLGPGAIQM